MENTKIRMSRPSKPSSIMLARNMLAFSVENDPAFVRFAASRVITKDAPDRGDQAHHQEWLGNQKMRADGYADRVQNLHQHQHDQQLVQYSQRLGGNRPVTEAIPEHFARVGNGR